MSMNKNHIEKDFLCKEDKKSEPVASKSGRRGYCALVARLQTALLCFLPEAYILRECFSIYQDFFHHFSVQ